MIKKLIILGRLLMLVFLMSFIFSGCSNLKSNVKNSETENRYNRITSMMKIKLPDVPQESKILDMTFFYTPFATCYLDTRASIANYCEKIPYDEFVWYSRPFEFKYQGKNGEIRTGIGGGEQTIEAFHNLGYKVYHGNTEEKFEIANLMRHENADDNYIFFKNQEEAFEFVKKLISINYPVSVKFNGDYHLVFGYEKDYVYIPPYKDLKTGSYIFPDKMPLFKEPALSSKDYQKLTTKQFFSYWKTSGNSFSWFEKIGDRKTKEEMFEINKKDALSAAKNSMKFAEDPKFESYTSDGDGAIYTASGSRRLKNIGYSKLADKYMEIASCYNKLSIEKKECSYSTLAKLYQEAVEIWK